MIFYPADISHFHSFCCHLGSQLGSLLQKCDPDKCDRNLHKSRLCFFTQQAFSIFIPVAVTWGPNLDPYGESVILTGQIKIHRKVDYVFLPNRIFLFSFLWLPLVSQLGLLLQKCDPDKCDQTLHKSRLCVFYPADIFHFHFFGCHLGPQLGSLRQKCDPDRCDQNLHKNCLCFLTQQTFSIFIPSAVTWGPNFDPCGKSMILASAIKIQKNIYGFLPNRHFPFSFPWLSLGVPT